MNLQTIPEEALKEILALTEAKKTLELREKAQDYFMPFAHHVYENFIEGRHHRIIAEKLEKVARGEIKRLIINMHGFWVAIRSLKLFKRLIIPNLRLDLVEKCGI